MAKRGVPKRVLDPETFKTEFEAYKKWCEANPILVHDFVGKDGNSVHRERQRPLTNEGFNIWLRKRGVIDNAYDYFNNKEGRYEDFALICRAIKEEIRNEQILGGMAGIYNPSITQRLNGLTEKQETTVQNPDGTAMQITLNLTK